MVTVLLAHHGCVIAIRTNALRARIGLAFNERQQIGVYLVLQGKPHSMRRPFVDLKSRTGDFLCGFIARERERNDLIVVAVHDQRRDIEGF
jgi:hypothetical protein